MPLFCSIRKVLALPCAQRTNMWRPMTSQAQVFQAAVVAVVAAAVALIPWLIEKGDWTNARLINLSERRKSQSQIRLKLEQVSVIYPCLHVMIYIFSRNISRFKRKRFNLGDEPFLRLCLRLPNGTRETISICATETIEVSARDYPPNITAHVRKIYFISLRSRV